MNFSVIIPSQNNEMEDKMFRLLLLSVGMMFMLSACATSVEADPNSPVVSPTEGAGETPAQVNPYQPLESDAALQRGEAFLDSTDVLILESYPVQINLVLTGNLPTPCHQLRIAVNQPDEANRILVEVYSVVDPEQVCIQMLQPFEATYSLGSFPSGSYTVLVNGEEVGQFDS